MRTIEVQALDVTLKPADLAGASNGAIDPKCLRPIHGGQLHHRAADAWEAMVEAAALAGVQLEPTHMVDTYRSLEVQRRVFQRRYTTEKQGTSGFSVSWQGQRWYLRPQVAPAAIPGTSSYGWGLSVDVKGVSIPHRAEWLKSHAAQFGWAREIPAEAWHLRYCAGDVVPAAVTSFLLKQKGPGEHPADDRHWTSLNLLEATRGSWTFAPLSDGWTAGGLCVSAPAMRYGDIVVVRTEQSEKGLTLKALRSLGATPQALITDGEPGFDQELPPSVPVLQVADSAAAILDMGRYARTRMTGKVVGVTGSAGKTTIVAMLAHMLAPWGSVATTQHNANQPHGIAWNLASIPWDTPHVVLEMSISGMRESAQLVRPHVAIVATISGAHQEFHGDADEIALRKSRIFSGMLPGAIAIINRDIPQWNIVSEEAGRLGLRIITYGRHAQSHLQLTGYEASSRTIEARVGKKLLRYRLGAPGEHMAMNSLACIATLEALGLTSGVSLPLLSVFRPVAGRGTTHDVTIDGQRLRLVDETSSATPESMTAAIRTFAETPPALPTGRRVLVLADMFELGPDSANIHAALADEIRRAKPALVLLCGQDMKHLKDALPAAQDAMWAPDLAELQDMVRVSVLDGDLVLLKGAGGMHLSRIVDWLKGE